MDIILGLVCIYCGLEFVFGGDTPGLELFGELALIAGTMILLGYN